MSDDENANRYSSPGGVAARFVSQKLVMKPYIWSVLLCTARAAAISTCSSPRSSPSPITPATSTRPLVMCSLPRRLAQNLAAGAAADYFFDTWYTAARHGDCSSTAFPVDRQGLRSRGTGRRAAQRGHAASAVPRRHPFAHRGDEGLQAGRSRTLSISRNVPVLPIALVGAYAAMPYGATVPVPGRPHVHVVFGRPLKAAPGEIAHQFADRLLPLRRRVARHHGTRLRHAHPGRLRTGRSHFARPRPNRRNWRTPNRRRMPSRPRTPDLSR